MQRYHLILDCLQPIFDWLRKVVSTLVTSDWDYILLCSLKLEEVLPEEYRVISLFADVLLAGGTCLPYSLLSTSMSVLAFIEMGRICNSV